MTLPDLETTFGPVQNDDPKWYTALLDIVSGGASLILGNFFDDGTSYVKHVSSIIF